MIRTLLTAATVIVLVELAHRHGLRTTSRRMWLAGFHHAQRPSFTMTRDGYRGQLEAARNGWQ